MKYLLVILIKRHFKVNNDTAKIIANDIIKEIRKIKRIYETENARKLYLNLWLADKYNINTNDNKVLTLLYKIGNIIVTYNYFMHIIKILLSKIRCV